ncbi:MAG: SDR family oxidoreductase, partial [Magnetococcales bacterium]|nr:SDR family oxidoreductase [Magnetococcales bacterium]
RQGVGRFVYFSTAHVYGAPLVGDLTEESFPQPSHPYAITHRTAEDFVLTASRQGRIRGLVLRLSNGIGAPADPDVDRWTLLVNDLCRQAVTKHALTLHSAGHQLRDFITMEDIGNAMAHLLTLPDIAWGDGLFNLGGGASHSVLEMTRRIVERCDVTLGFQPPISRPEAAPGESSSQTLHYSVAKLEDIGFTPRGRIDKALDETLLLCKASFAAE